MPDLTGLPTSLKSKSRWLKLANVPALVAHPDWHGDAPALPARPWLLWMHGRSVNKELDPGRYQRLVRAGIATVAVDLPGHGERRDEALQTPARTLEVIATMLDEIDAIVDAAHELGGLDIERVAIGGMSAGGMATLARLCRPHRFRCAIVECTTGSWRWQPNLVKGDERLVQALNPIEHLDGWRPLPLLAMNNRFDQWVPIAGAQEFIDALAARTQRPDLVTWHVYDRTGARSSTRGSGHSEQTRRIGWRRFLAERL